MQEHTRFCSQRRERQLTTSKVQRSTVAPNGGGGEREVSKEVSKEARKEMLSPPSHGPRSTEAEAEEASLPSNYIVAFPILVRHQSPQATVPPEDEVVVVPSRHKFAKVLHVVTIVASK